MEIDPEKVNDQILQCEWKDLRDNPDEYSDKKSVVVTFEFLRQESFELEVPERVLLDMKFGDCSWDVKNWLESEKNYYFKDFIESEEVPLVEATISKERHGVEQ